MVVTETCQGRLVLVKLIVSTTTKSYGYSLFYPLAVESVHCHLQDRMINKLGSDSDLCGYLWNVKQMPISHTQTFNCCIVH